MFALSLIKRVGFSLTGRKMMPTRRRSHKTGTTFRTCRWHILFLPLLIVSCATYNPLDSFLRELEDRPASGQVISGVPDIDRLNRKNSLSALNTLVDFWGEKPLSLKDALGRIGPDMSVEPVDDIVQDQLVDRGLWSFSFYGTIGVLEERLDKGLPLLVIVQDNAMNIETRRYMVLVGINRSTQKVLAHEGGPYPGVYSYEHFRKIWWPVRNWVMVICPPDNITWDLRMLEHVALARYQEKRGNWSGAIEDYNRAIKVDPYNLELKLAKGDAMYQSGDALAALSLYRTVLNNNDLSARAANNLAYVLAETNADVTEAERLVRRALVIEPSNPLYLDTLGFVLLKAGRHLEATEVLTRAHRRMDAMSVIEQRKIVSRLILAFDESNQSHLSQQILEEYRIKDPQFDPKPEAENSKME